MYIYTHVYMFFFLNGILEWHGHGVYIFYKKLCIYHFTLNCIPLHTKLQLLFNPICIAPCIPLHTTSQGKIVISTIWFPIALHDINLDLNPQAVVQQCI